MVVVRDIHRSEMPAEAARVIIEFGGGRFVANGFKPGRQSGTSWTPPAFDTLDDAIEASVEWASKNGVPAVYIKGIRGRVGISQ
jgi:hypothetical protein